MPTEMIYFSACIWCMGITFFSTVFQDSERVIMKGYVQLNTIYDEKRSALKDCGTQDS